MQMEPPVDIDQVTVTAQRHWMEDGLSEIMVGLLFIVMGGGLLVKLALPHWLTLDLLTSALTAAGALGLSWGFKRLKQRITFPRSGYVALPEPTRMR
jgi:Trk-type K+ transport system membrane component